uniref:Si:dkey-106n21.1 n=1 Tax=Sinocyclocheilus grahami TaxID=75366 RepID=A0A672R6P1_SINGR
SKMPTYEICWNNLHFPQISDCSHDPEKIVIADPHANSLEEGLDSRPEGNLIYSINDHPPWYLCILLGFQHYILAFGGILAIPLILAEPLCIKENHATTLGTRLPILQGGTFTFITPTLAILALPKWRCPGTSATSHLNATDSAALLVDGDAVWKVRICEIQGAILVASMLQLVLGLSGLVGLVLRFIGPLAIDPTINLIGLSLFIQAGQKSGAHWGIAALMVCLILLFSQYLSKVNLPLIAYKDKKWKVFHYPLFKLFSVSVLYCNYVCIMNFAHLLTLAFFLGEWGLPTVSVSSVLGMMAGVLASTMESIGDYYACARLSGAPPPPTHAINRGIAVEGVGCILAALWGTGNVTTSYSQNIAALGITRVGFTAGLLMIILGLFGKFSAVFITIPDPVIGGMFLLMFGMVAAVGISNLQYVDLNSSRNLLILGFSIFSDLVLPTWFNSNPGINELDPLIMILFTTHMFIGGSFGFVLDNTIPDCMCLHGYESTCQPPALMEYTLKGYAFDCTLTLAYVYKNDVYLGHHGQKVFVRLVPILCKLCESRYSIYICEHNGKC